MPLQNYGNIAAQMADLPNPVNTFLASRQNAEQVQQRNALMQSEANQNNAIAEGVGQKALEAQHLAEVRQGLSRIRWIRTQGPILPQMQSDPQKAAELSQRVGQDVTKMSEEQLQQLFGQMEGQFASLLGEMPPQPKPAAAPQYRSVGNQLLEIPTEAGGTPRVAYTAPERVPLRSGGGSAVGGMPKPAKAPEGYRWSSDGESLEAIPGGPKDQAAIQPLSPKDTNTARVKLTQVRVARRQLENARKKWQPIKNSFSAGPGGQFVPTPSGQAFDAAIDSMRGSITALTRVPGVGQMSDYETRLDQAKFPTRGKYEQVTEQQLQALTDLLDTIEQGYTSLLGGQSSEPAVPSAPTRRKFNQQTGKIE